MVAYLPLLLQGLRMTLHAGGLDAGRSGWCSGCCWRWRSCRGDAWVSRPAYAVTNFLRGIPEFLVLLVIYFGGTQVLDSILPPAA